MDTVSKSKSPGSVTSYLTFFFNFVNKSSLKRNLEDRDFIPANRGETAFHVCLFETESLSVTGLECSSVISAH